ncbi:MAG TPA: hypothetical protein DCS23_00365 [Candidatus Yonathbacteria bacterium]|nr:hypothetical protein [Candidatus Yonathbacteria bacterium]
MKILPIHPEIEEYLKTHKLVKKFEKQSKFFEKDPTYPSLEAELLEPKHLKIYSFRVDKKYRAIFVFIRRDAVEIIDVNNHYR